MSTLQNVTLSTTSNIYFDGKCVSHSVELADGSTKTVGVIFPSSLMFNTGAPETMEIVGGKCRVRLAGADSWQLYQGGEQFAVPGNSAFEIETLELVDYVCHFG
jgi:uncharacterized protein YaiE (UPF0345 family)